MYYPWAHACLPVQNLPRLFVTSYDGLLLTIKIGMHLLVFNIFYKRFFLFITIFADFNAYACRKVQTALTCACMNMQPIHVNASNNYPEYITVKNVLF